MTIRTREQRTVRRGVFAVVIAWIAAAGGFAAAAAETADNSVPDVIVVVGASGADEYGEPFRTWAERWKRGAAQGGVPSVTIGLEESTAKSDRERLQEELTRQVGQNERRLWLVLIGHGTFDGKNARFGLRGEDVTPRDLREWLGPITRPVAVLDCSSCSAPFLTELSGPNRVIITATRAGSEFNFARFGDALSAAIDEPAADLDKDEQASLLEAYLYASARTAEFYAGETRLQTEHALLDDNADKLGTPADFFEGLKATKTAKSGAQPDGALASRFILVPSPREAALPDSVRTRRDELERELARIRTRKETLEEEEYWRQVEKVVTEIAHLYGESGQ